MRRHTLNTLVVAAALALLPAAARAQCTLPAAPSGVSGTLGCNQTTITWNPVPTATQYRVIGRSTFGSQVFNVLRSTPSFVYVAAPGNPAQSFIVSAINTCGEGPASPAVALPYSAGTPIAQVFSFAASNGTTCAGVTITWLDTTNQGLSGYRITRTAADQPTASFDVPAGQTSFTDTTALGAITYTYSIAPLNPCGAGPARSTTGLRAAVVPTAPTPTATPRAATAVLVAPLLTIGNPGATFAWRRGVDATGAGGTPVVNDARITGASTAQLTITNLRPEDAALYACTATSCSNTVSSGAVALVVTTACSSDFDGSGVRNIADIFAFLSSWFAGCP